MTNKLTNGMALVLTSTCLYSTGHWIAATILLILFVLHIWVED